jgi:multisubunit Na+/H+ antiporter MnhG subunit
LAAEAVVAAELGTTLKAIAAIVFLLFTAPVAAHLIGRAAYHQGIRLFEKTWTDELGDSLSGKGPTAKKPSSDASDTSSDGNK